MQTRQRFWARITSGPMARMAAPSLAPPGPPFAERRAGSVTEVAAQLIGTGVWL